MPPSCHGYKASTVTTLTPELYAHVKGVLLRDQNFVKRENEPRVYSKTQGEDSFAATSLWLKRTQWPAIFHKSRRDILGQGPSRGDPDILQHIWEHQVWATIDVPRGFWPARPSYAENHAPLRGAQPDISGPMRWSDARLSSNEEYDAESDEDNYETSEDEDELHKAKRLTNREFHVIRFLPIRLGVASNTSNSNL
uniref:Uncharacterized protein n=1 Tax=Fusarium oxysporum (strain Fo5176) TaxID=660025 RepID=A0A0D2YF19_FUSOF